MKPQTANSIPLPPAAMVQEAFGFIGRHRTIHVMEQTLQQQAEAGLLIHGVAGVGKTILVQGFIQWLQQTDALEKSIFWFRFDEIRNIEYIINQMVQGLFGTEALASPMQQKMDNVCAVFKQNPFIIVWDNFECASGIEGVDVPPFLTDDDRKQLKEFLQRLHNGKTKVIITSRSSETWLSATECSRLPLGGLQDEECWQYCNAVSRHLNLTLDRADTDSNYSPVSDLMQKLDGHPLAMRVVLLRLAETPAAVLLKELEQGFDPGDGQDECAAHTDAAFELLETLLPPEYTAVLQFIGLHQRYVQLNTLTDMMKNSDLVTSQITIKDCFVVLERAGLVRPQQKDMYAIHPALNEYLRRRHPAETAVQGAFVDLMGHFSDHLAPKAFQDQRAPFYIHSANFHYALSLAITLDMAGHVTALTQSLAVFALNNRDFQGAARLFEKLASHYHQHNDDEGIASCYHQLGRIAQEQRSYVQAEQWYLRSLAIKEQQGDEQGSANTFAQLGALQRLQQHWVAAAQWFIKAAITFSNSNDTQAVARVAQVYIALLQQSDAKYQCEIKQLWEQSGLTEAVGPLEVLIERLSNAEKNIH